MLPTPTLCSQIESRALHRRSGSQGYTLVEILIVIAVILIIATIAIPSLSQSKKAGNEATAISHLRTLTSAQALYQNRYGSYATSHDELVTAGLMSVSADRLGYSVSVEGDGSVWSAQANPLIPGVTGDRYFYVDDGGIVRWDVYAPADPASPALGTGGGGGAGGGRGLIDTP